LKQAQEDTQHCACLAVRAIFLSHCELEHVDLDIESGRYENGLIMVTLVVRVLGVAVAWC
jgi:hypothetical protein